MRLKLGVRFACSKAGAPYGMGILAEALPHIFELFAQSERSLGRTDGGLGIGLTEARSRANPPGC